MSASKPPEELQATVRSALETTRAVAVCPFHHDVVIRVGDDAAETHAFLRARNSLRGNGKRWKAEALKGEFKRQLAKAADHHCPHCARPKGL